jgi:hypothetical protein
MNNSKRFVIYSVTSIPSLKDSFFHDEAFVKPLQKRRAVQVAADENKPRLRDPPPLCAGFKIGVKEHVDPLENKPVGSTGHFKDALAAEDVGAAVAKECGNPRGEFLMGHGEGGGNTDGGDVGCVLVLGGGGGYIL